MGFCETVRQVASEGEWSWLRERLEEDGVPASEVQGAIEGYINSAYSRWMMYHDWRTIPSAWLFNGANYTYWRGWIGVPRAAGPTGPYPWKPVG